MKPIKKLELRILKKSAVSQPQLEELALVDTISTNEHLIEEPLATEYLPSYAPVQDYPLLQSVGNSGWQVSDIWRDIRIDGFCD